MKALKLILPGLALVTAITVQARQDYNPSRVQVHVTGEKPLDMVIRNIERSTKAIDYGKGSNVTNVNIRSTSLLPTARGEAKVERKQRRIEIEAEFDGLQAATRFGPEYLTYILWAITPEGCAANLGEVVLNDLMTTKLNVTTELQVFGLIVTAEPYFAVSQPSDVVVMENVFSTASSHRRETAKYGSAVTMRPKNLKLGRHVNNFVVKKKSISTTSPRLAAQPSGVIAHRMYVRYSGPKRVAACKPSNSASISIRRCFSSTFASPRAVGNNE